MSSKSIEKHRDKWSKKGLKKNGPRVKTKPGTFFVIYCRACNLMRKITPGTLRSSICKDGHITEIRNGIRL